jgi:hypothetical protein
MPLDPTTEAVLAELAAAAGSSATSTRTTRTAASCAGAPAASSSPSTTGSRRSIPYPAAPEDCRAAKVWAAAHAEALGDPLLAPAVGEGEGSRCST